MKVFGIIVVAAVILIGCGGPPESSNKGQTSSPKQMPTAVGVTAGQTGTGTTSGASTGY